ncbi:T9SS type A sorting domain-containing protein, partial [bacterium]|nr:T9SS type A sorting domain-containing protein [bacterium]
DSTYQRHIDSLVVEWTGEDNASGIAYFEYALGSTAGGSDIVDFQQVGLATSDTLKELSLQDNSSYFLTVRAMDVAGNLSDPILGDGIFIDTTPPVLGTIFDGASADIAYTGSDSTLVATWTGFSDGSSGLKGYEISVNNGEFYPWTFIGDVTTHTITDLVLTHATSYTVDLRAMDKAGNVSQHISTDGVIIDTEPSTSGVDVADEFYNENGWNSGIQISGFAQEPDETQSGLTQVEVSIFDGSLYWDGGSWSETEVWNRTEGNSDWSYNLSSTDLSDGLTYFISSRATDAVGNVQQELGLDSFTYDITEPQTTIDIQNIFYNQAGFTSEQPLVGTASDEISGLSLVEISILNTETSQYWNRSSWSDGVYWNGIDDSQNWSYPDLDVSSLDDGTEYLVEVRSVDIAGNVEASVEQDFFTFDTTRPGSEIQISREFYNNSNWLDASSINGVTIDATSGIESISLTIRRGSDQYYWGGSGWTLDETWLSPDGGGDAWAYGYNLNNLTNGVSYYVSSRATDVAGNVQLPDFFGQDTFTFDVTAPNVGSVNDGNLASDQDWSNSTEVFSANWSGFSDVTSGIVGYEYSIGTTPGATDVIFWTENGQEIEFSVPVTVLSGSDYYVSVRATDAADNVSNITTSDGITIDALDPTVSGILEGSTSEDYDYQQDNTSLTFSWSGSDALRNFRNGRDLSSFSVSLGTDSAETDVVGWTNVGNANTYTMNGLSLNESVTYYVNVKALDLAGNESDIVSGDGITIDQSGPEVGTLNDGNELDIDWVNINYLSVGNWEGFSDNLSGIAEYEYSLGLAPGETQLVTWTSANLDTAITVSASLTEGPTYFANVRAIDAVTNVGSIVSSDGFGLDQSAPTTGNVYDAIEGDLTWSNVFDTLFSSWNGFQDEYSGVYSYEYSVGTSSGSQDFISWTNIDSLTNFTLNTELSHGTTYYTSVRATDLVDNVSNSVSSNGVTIDTTSPVLSLMVETAVNDPLFQGSDSSITLIWEGSDDLSGVALYEYALGTSLGSTDLVEWTETGTDLSVVINDLNLEDGSTYYGSVRAFDLAGNMSLLNGSGVMVDITSPESGLVIDGLSEDNDYMGNTSIQVSWSDFSDNGSGIEYYEYSLLNVEMYVPETVIDFTSVGQEQSVTRSDLSLVHGSEYMFTVRAIDSVGNVSELAMSNGFIVDEYSGPPQITSLSVDTLSYIPLISNTELVIELSEPLSSYEVTMMAMIDNGFTYNTVYMEDPPMLTVTFNAPFASLDTLTLQVNSMVDIAGIPAEDRLFTYYTSILGDYNNDLSVDASDLSTFITAWGSDDFTKELGPVTGEVPHLIPASNSSYDLRDVMAFTRMWHYFKTSSSPVFAYEPIGLEADLVQDGTSISFDLPDEASAVHLQVLYPSGNRTLAPKNNYNSKDLIQLVHEEKDNGVFIVDRAFMKSAITKNVSFDLSSEDRQNTLIQVGYVVYDASNQIMMSGSKTIDVASVPDNFALHQNYPNPFNPSTAINYDLPKSGYTEIVIFDIMGREVTKLSNKVMEAGYHTVRWNGANNGGRSVSAGVYFCTLTSPSFVKTIKLVLLK